MSVYSHPIFDNPTLIGVYFPRHVYYPNRPDPMSFINSSLVARTAFLAGRSWEETHGTPPPFSLTERSARLIMPRWTEQEILNHPAVAMAECYLPAARDAERALGDRREELSADDVTQKIRERSLSSIDLLTQLQSYCPVQ